MLCTYFNVTLIWTLGSNELLLLASFLVSTLKEQLEDMRKISQNSQASNDKIVQLQNQVHTLTHTHKCIVWMK